MTHIERNGQLVNYCFVCHLAGIVVRALAAGPKGREFKLCEAIDI
jgi:hypothetical protein